MRKYFLLLALIAPLMLLAQKKKKPAAVVIPNADSMLLSQVKYRLVGPFRGGRSAAVTGSYRDKNTFYFGATGGGVWKSADGGSNWKNISDGYFGGSIGSVAVAPGNEQVIYAGEGENTMRGNVSEGLGGMWKSTDGGRTWKNAGLKDGRHIVRIVVHPHNPDIAWVAVMGHLFGASETRGVYKTTDGGKNWKRTLYVNNQSGACDLVMEPGNPDILYAGTWRVLRTPYSLESGGEGSGLWKSTDGGDTWSNISAAKGLPKGTWGIVGVAVAPSNTGKLYALIENAAGGLFVSADTGKTWSLASSDNNIRQRAWYYTHVFVDPTDENLVYCPNVEFMVSRDGGKTFKSIETPHGDHHDLWIDPENGKRMIVADDGGAQVSYDGGANWSSYHNQPTAQIYRVSTDNAFPYRVLGAQQDNSTLRIRSRSAGPAITEADWQATAGAESGYVVADPLNPDVVYGGNYGGYLSRLDHKTGENRAVSVWPDNPMGAGADVQKYRFQWNFPVFFSPHNPKKLYCAGNVLFATENEGESWTAVSGDLTTNDKRRQASSGGPITQDNTSVEYYCTIFTATESWVEKDLLWTGSDDGVISVSKDGGRHWENVTPKDCPKWMMWNCVEVDPFKKGTAYFAGTRYKSDDFTPYIYKTEDYGKNWVRITNGIPPMHFARCLRADRKRPGLLYAGTEYGMYISYDDGKNWKPFQLNLPPVPITDLTIKNNDLIVATQGRAIWIIDDLTLVQNLDKHPAGAGLQVFDINPAYRMQAGHPRSFGGTPRNAGANPPEGVVVNFYAGKVEDSTRASVTILDSSKKAIKVFSTAAKEKADKIEVNNGMNRFVWNMQYPGAERIEGMILWNGVPGNIPAAPGKYYARVRVGEDSSETVFEVLADPNYTLSRSAYDEQLSFLLMVRDKFNEVQRAIGNIRRLRGQINGNNERWGAAVPHDQKLLSDSILKRLSAIEDTLYQTRAKSGQDVLNYPIRLNDKLAGVFNTANSGNMAPSAQARAVYSNLAAQCDVTLAAFNKLLKEDLPRLNQAIRESKLPVVGIPE